MRLLWQGSFFDPSGYSEEARCLLFACESVGVGFAAREWPTFSTTVELSAEHRTTIERALDYPEPPRPYVEVLHKTIPPASRATLYPETGPTVLRTMFETDSLPAGWAGEVARFDRVWVPGAFNLETFERAGVPAHKLRRLPETVDFRALSSVEPLELPRAAAGTRFLSVFEFSERKGWRVLLDAWADTFAPSDDVSLILKCSGRVMQVTDARSRIDAHLGERRTAPIVVIDRDLPVTEMARLYRACDAFVLASRGEGWGRPLMEAMAADIPTIGPAWGGNREFMSPANSFLVEGQVVRIDPAELVFERYVGQRWFEPDRQELSSALRAVAAGGAEVSERAARGAREIREKFSHARVAAILERLVTEALGGEH
jgi:glycosyltransferase involved in cell wall biosynthesis